MTNQITPQKVIAFAGIIIWIIGAQIGDYQMVDFAKDAVFVGIGIEIGIWVINKINAKSNREHQERINEICTRYENRF
jgi:hypothetical protein